MRIAYFEDIEVGHKSVIGSHQVEKEEMVAFAKTWDPRPFHVDEEMAKSQPGGALIASSSYTMSVVTRVSALYEDPRPVTFGLMEYERVQIIEPVRAGDLLTITVERLSKKSSRSKPDRGIIRSLIEVINQDGQPVLRYISAIMAAKRPA